MGPGRCLPARRAKQRSVTGSCARQRWQYPSPHFSAHSGQGQTLLCHGPIACSLQFLMQGRAAPSRPMRITEHQACMRAAGLLDCLQGLAGCLPRQRSAPHRAARLTGSECQSQGAGEQAAGHSKDALCSRPPLRAEPARSSSCRRVRASRSRASASRPLPAAAAGSLSCRNCRCCPRDSSRSSAGERARRRPAAAASPDQEGLAGASAWQGREGAGGARARASFELCVCVSLGPACQHIPAKPSASDSLAHTQSASEVSAKVLAHGCMEHSR